VGRHAAVYRAPQRIGAAAEIMSALVAQYADALVDLATDAASAMAIAWTEVAAQGLPTWCCCAAREDASVLAAANADLRSLGRRNSG